MGLTDCELRGKSNARNAVRRKRKGEGKVPLCLCDLLLRLLDVWNLKKYTVNGEAGPNPRAVD